MHFEPVSNGGPRADMPAEECALLLIHPTARSICPPVREVRTGDGEAERGSPGPAGRPAGWQGSGRLRCAHQASWASVEITKEKVTLKEAESSSVPLYPPNSTVFSELRVQRRGVAAGSVFVAVW